MYNFKPIKFKKPKQLTLVPIKPRDVDTKKIKKIIKETPTYAKLPLFGFQPLKPPVPNKPNKNLSYPQAAQKYQVPPYGNYDRDKHLNIFDCRPFDWMRHKVPEEHKNKPVLSYTKPGSTFASVFAEAEKEIPHVFKQGGGKEELYSEYLTKALLQRQKFEQLYKLKDSPFKNVVGTYEMEVPFSQDETKLAHHYIENYLEDEYPGHEFKFDLHDPKHVTVKSPAIDPTTKQPIVDPVSGRIQYTEKVGQRLANYLDKAPKSIRDLLTNFSTNKKITIVISDNPVDVLRKSAVYKTGGLPGEFAWTSCEALGSGGSDTGCFSDVESWNAIAWYYFAPRIPGKDSPTGRVMMRWGLTKDGKPDVNMERRMYGIKDPEAWNNLLEGLRRLLEKKGFTTQNIVTPYRYSGYSDMVNREETRQEISKEFGISTSEIDSSGKIMYPAMKPKEYKFTPPEIHALKVKYVQEKKKVPEPFARRFLHESDPLIRRHLAQKEMAPSYESRFVTQLAGDENEAVRISIAGRQNLPVDIISQLAQDKSMKVKLALITGPNKIPNELIAPLIKDEKAALLILEKYKISDKPEFLEAYISHPSTEVRLKLCEKSLPAQYLEKLAHDHSPEIREALVSNHGSELSPETIMNLSQDPERYVRESLITNTSIQIPDNVLQNLIKKGLDKGMLREIAKRQSLSLSTAIELIKVGDSETVNYTVGNTSLMIDRLTGPERNNVYLYILNLAKATPYVLGYIPRDPELRLDIIKLLLSHYYLHAVYESYESGETVISTLIKNPYLEDKAYKEIFVKTKTLTGQSVSFKRNIYTAIIQYVKSPELKELIGKELVAKRTTTKSKSTVKSSSYDEHGHPREDREGEEI